MAKCSITQSGADYAVKTPFSQTFVNTLKANIPHEHRRFDKDSKAWIVERSYAESLPAMIEEIFGEAVTIPAFKPVTQEFKYSFQLDYVGIPKERPEETIKTASGFSKGSWRIIFAEDVLKGWFEQCQAERDLPETLFSLLLLKESATDQEIKSAYRRLARQWHPDVCKEDNAEEVFKKIQSAYSILSDENKRKRYLAGLEFERASNQVPAYRSNWKPDVFIPPLRCGFLIATGSVQVGRLRVSQILSWQDVTNEQGLTMVTSWNKKAKAIDYQWV